MTQWGKYDAASNVPLWISSQLNQSVNVAMSDTSNTLFNNVTANTYFVGRTDGVFAVDADEMAAIRVTDDAKPAHAGWVLRTEGSGGRAGRVSYETLVAGGSFGIDDSEDTIFPDKTIIISTQPFLSNVITGNAISFSVSAYTVPAGGTLNYQWQRDANSATGNAATGPWANVPASGVFTNTTTATLTISNNATLNNNVFRVIVRTIGASNVFSSNASVKLGLH
jgi:hypothetical protein